MKVEQPTRFSSVELRYTIFTGLLTMSDGREPIDHLCSESDVSFALPEMVVD
jgi:hypothetical protein